MKKSAVSHPSQAHRKPRRRSRPTEPPPTTDLNPSSDANVPCWLPKQASDLGVPEDVHESLTRIIIPAYRACVLEASGELERTIGNSVVYFTWLELIHQIRLANIVADPTSADGILHDPDQLTDRCLQLMSAKCQAAALMFKIRMATESLNRFTASQTPMNILPPPVVQQALPSDQFDAIDHFATKSMPPQIGNPKTC